MKDILMKAALFLVIALTSIQFYREVIFIRYINKIQNYFSERDSFWNCELLNFPYGVFCSYIFTMIIFIILYDGSLKCFLGTLIICFICLYTSQQNIDLALSRMYVIYFYSKPDERKVYDDVSCKYEIKSFFAFPFLNLSYADYEKAKLKELNNISKLL